MDAAVENVPAVSLNLDPRLYSDDHIPELVAELMAVLLSDDQPAHRHQIHRCACCPAVWDEDA